MGDFEIIYIPATATEEEAALILACRLSDYDLGMLVEQEKVALGTLETEISRPGH